MVGCLLTGVNKIRRALFSFPESTPVVKRPSPKRKQPPKVWRLQSRTALLIHHDRTSASWRTLSEPMRSANSLTARTSSTLMPPCAVVRAAAGAVLGLGPGFFLALASLSRLLL